MTYDTDDIRGLVNVEIGNKNQTNPRVVRNRFSGWVESMVGGPGREFSLGKVQF
jgi:hypothetical protein